MRKVSNPMTETIENTANLPIRIRNFRPRNASPICLAV